MSRLLRDPAAGPETNMARDEEIAREVCLGLAAPTLRIYRWSEPAISLGRRQKAEELPDSTARLDWPRVRRPTGGGAVLHDLNEWTYALAIPRSALSGCFRLNDIPGFIHQRLAAALEEEGGVLPGALSWVEGGSCCGPAPLCFSSPVQGDLLFKGKKVAGAALRAWREGLLIQGSLQGVPSEGAPLCRALERAVEEWLEKNNAEAGI